MTPPPVGSVWLYSSSTDPLTFTMFIVSVEEDGWYECRILSAEGDLTRSRYYQPWSKHRFVVGGDVLRCSERIA